VFPSPGTLFSKWKSPRKEERRVALIKDLFLSLKAKLKSSRKVVGEIMYGLLVHEMDVTMKKERGNIDNLFMLVVFGDLIGLPLLPPYYSMRLLPHIIPSLETWKRRVLREKDLTDFVSHDLWYEIGPGSFIFSSGKKLILLWNPAFRSSVLWKYLSVVL
jgi:hypothetical protein